MKPLIVIPARYASTRFPGKPLAKIGEKMMIERTADVARRVVGPNGLVDFVVATDDERIEAACRACDLPVVMTDPDLASGSDRALAAANVLGGGHDIIVNLQGDAPLTPPEYVQSVIMRLAEDKNADIATPVVNLTWAALDQLRTNKLSTPFSGTTAIVSESGYAKWFSKNIIPAVRKEDKRRTVDGLSPIYQHIGLYGFRREALQAFTALPESTYEAIEGLEQLRALEAGLVIACVKVPASQTTQSGIDTPEDLQRLEAELAALGRL